MRRFLSNKFFPLWAIAALTFLHVSFQKRETHPARMVCNRVLDLARPVPAWFGP